MTVEDELGAIVAGRPRSIPGVAVAIMQGDDVVEICDGVTNVDHPLPVDGDTRFAVGSVTKTITATAVIALVQDGALRLDDLAASHLPAVDLGSGGEVTIEHLLSHRGGWQGDWALFNAPVDRDSSALSDLVAAARVVPRTFPPGGPFGYDNFGWCVLGHVIERVAGRPFEEAVRELVLAPLGLAATTFAAEDVVSHRVCAGHHPDGAGGAYVVRAAEPWADQWSLRRALAPAGGAATSLGDAVRWLRFHLGVDGGAPPPQGRGHGAMPAIPRDLMFEPRAASGGQGTEIGLGWHLRSEAGRRVASHSGLAQGFFAQLVVVPELRSGLAVLTNSADGQGWVPSVVDRYLREVVRLPDEPSVVAAPTVDPQSLLGTYSNVARRLVVRAATAESVTVAIEDLAGAPAQVRTVRLTFTAEPGRLVGLDDPGLRMEHGVHGGVPWLRYRGRLHVGAARPPTRGSS